ncbi:MAG: LysM peptidoglycan-binding domain-containing protein [Synechococcaceae cyanobacterium SM2_3_1]|nr:LysM peptidoglycan-binding domain-containing protein [Synechococcaceae cyanobacterium SM2_3_1]
MKDFHLWPPPTPTNTAAPALPTPTSIPVDKCSYFVVEGDTLTQIAVKLDISTEAFIQANPALQINPNSLSIGQELRIPNCESDLTPTVESNTVDLPPFATVEGTSPQITLAPGQTIQHLVQPGENLYRISLRYGVTVDAIKQANGLQRHPAGKRGSRTAGAASHQGRIGSFTNPFRSASSAPTSSGISCSTPSQQSSQALPGSSG